MRTLYRILSVLTLSALMSTPVLRAQDDQSYDAQTDQQYDQNQNYDQNEAPSAEDRPLETPQYDPPSRVASLRYMDGSVSIQPQGTGDWVAGEINRPVTNADNIWADRNSRAELSVGSGVVRIGSESSLTITDISEDTVQLQLHQGALNLHVRRLFDNERYEVDTPNQAFTVLKPGDYRFDVDSDGDKTVVTVWSGEGESTGDGPAVRIRANEQVRFSNGASMTVDVHTAPGPDSFDEWAFNRDQRRNNSESSRYVSPDVVGSDDLDEYGTWRSTPEYGEVWSPRVDAGWAPYSYGHWIWEDPWGWTWVDYEPWGFAPFHYGRWVYDDGFWGWAPGPVYARPYYAPALVAWFGGDFGGGFGLSVGFGGLGWCPLGFGEPFIPWYGVSSGYFNQVNITNTHITNITNITNIYNNNFSHGHLNVHNGYQMSYANMRAPGGFTAVSRHTLVNSLSVQRNRIRVSPNQLTRLSPIHSPSVAPTRATMIGSRGVRAAVPPQRAFARPVISRPAVSAGNRGSFNAGTRAGSGAVNRGSLNPGARGANATNASRPGQAGVAQRPTFGGAQQRPAIGATNRERFNNSASINNRGPAFNNARTPQNGSIGSRPVPRPPAATRNLGSRGLEPGTINSRPMNPQSSSVSRSMNSGPQMTARNNVPRPPMGGASQPSFSRGASPNFSRPSTPQSSAAPRSNDRNGPRSAVSVPRPSGAVAPRGYSSAADRGNYSSPRPSPSYQPNNRPGYAGGSYNRPSYSRPAPPSRDNGRGSYGRSTPLPSYGGSRSMPSYGGGRGPAYGNSGRSMPVPSYGGGGRAASPSFGGDRAPSYGGGGRSMPSYGGGGGGRAGGFGGGGGGHMPSGGGGQAPSGGGGHSGGGGSHSGGGRH